MNRQRKFWIMDYETIVNCFIAVFRSYDSDEQHIFVIGKHRNDIHLYIKFLLENQQNKDWHFGYNNLAFDAQITEHILENLEFYSARDGEEIAGRIYAYVKTIIDKSNKGEFLDYPEFFLKRGIVQIDALDLSYSIAQTDLSEHIYCHLPLHVPSF